jgi:hypothetical protein
MDPDDLYGLPLDRFTDERNALAKRLRQEGRRAESAGVAKLSKPSLAAWAVNQLVRTQQREVGALLKAGDALQKAQADVLAGRGSAGELRKAAEAERTALDRLTGKARGLLSSEGHELSPAKLEQVSETLHAAAIDEDVRARVRDGCLDRELRHVGLGALGAAPASAAAPAAARRARSRSDEERAAKLRSARQAEAATRREAERAERSARAAEERRDRAAERLQEAEDALATARELAAEATREHDRARGALDEL